MQTYECPHCHKPTISFWSKQFLGPGRSTACPGCGTNVGVPFSSMWVYAPLLLAIVVAYFTDYWGLMAWGWVGLAPGWALLAIGAAAAMALHGRYASLIKK